MVYLIMDLILRYSINFPRHFRRLHNHDIYTFRKRNQVINQRNEIPHRISVCPQFRQPRLIILSIHLFNEATMWDTDDHIKRIYLKVLCEKVELRKKVILRCLMRSMHPCLMSRPIKSINSGLLKSCIQLNHIRENVIYDHICIVFRLLQDMVFEFLQIILLRNMFLKSNKIAISNYNPLFIFSNHSLCIQIFVKKQNALDRPPI